MENKDKAMESAIRLKIFKIGDWFYLRQYVHDEWIEVFDGDTELRAATSEEALEMLERYNKNNLK